MSVFLWRCHVCHCSTEFRMSAIFSIPYHFSPLSPFIYFFMCSTATRLHPRGRSAVSVWCTAGRGIQPLHPKLHEIWAGAVGSGHDLLVQLYPHGVSIQGYDCDFLMCRYNSRFVDCVWITWPWKWHIVELEIIVFFSIHDNCLEST